MDKKKIFIIGGVVLALGVGFYFWNKSKNTTGGAEGGADGSAETPADTTKSTEASAESSTQTDTSVKTATSIKDLKGKVLGCHCHPLRCHGDYLKKLVDEN